MAYYWKCKKHNEVMVEKLDVTRSKIIPFCSFCNNEKEYEEALYDINKRSKYIADIPKYKRVNIRIGFQIFIILSSIVPFGILFEVIVMGEISAIFGAIIVILLMISISIHDMFFSNKAKQSLIEKSLPSLEQIEKRNKIIFERNQREVDDYKKRLKGLYMTKLIELDEIDIMDGYEFEQYTTRLLINLGYNDATVTRKSGDFGADIIAVGENNVKVAIQCKRYGTQNLVGNDAVQQIYSGMGYFDCQKAIVITTSYFSKPAIQMAQKLNVELWNRETLITKIASVNKESWNDFLSKYYIKPTSELLHVNEKEKQNNK